MLTSGPARIPSGVSKRFTERKHYDNRKDSLTGKLRLCRRAWCTLYYFCTGLSDALLEKALRFKTYWGTDGGITVSGGEPLLQIDFLLELFQKAKQQGVHTVIDTAGNPFTREGEFFRKFQALMEVTDLLLLDLKEINPERHRKLTGQENSNILDLARYLSEIGKPVWIRHVLVPKRSDYEEDLNALRRFLDTLDNVQRVEVLPYHTLGVFKWENLGIPYPLEGISAPTKERVENAERILGCRK